MTKNQKTALVAALKANPGGFAQPQQATCLFELIRLQADEYKLKLPEGFAQAVKDAYAPFYNASQQLAALKKSGIVPSELTAAQKAEAAELAAALKG